MSNHAGRPTCKLCRGKKKAIQTRRYNTLGFSRQEVIVCPECNGTGKPKEREK